MGYVQHNSAKLLQKDGFSGMEQDDESNYPFSTLKHYIEQLQSQDETLVPNYVTCDDILTFDDEVAATGNSN